MGRPTVLDTSKSYGLLTPIRRVGTTSHGAPLWLFRCECGVEKTIRSTSVTSGLTKSCGLCARKNQKNVGKHSTLFKGHESISGSYWSNIKCRAKNKGRDFLITPKDGWEIYKMQDGKCALSGVPIHFADRSHGQSTASLDRIDSRKGYTRDNVQWVNRHVNLMKRNMSDDEFISWCHLVSDFNRDKR